MRQRFDNDKCVNRNETVYHRGGGVARAVGAPALPGQGHHRDVDDMRDLNRSKRVVPQPQRGRGTHVRDFDLRSELCGGGLVPHLQRWRGTQVVSTRCRLLIPSLLIALFLPNFACQAPLSAGVSAKVDAAYRDGAALDAIFDAYWNAKLRQGPEWATYLGDHRFDDQLTDYSEAARDEQLQQTAALLGLVRHAAPYATNKDDRLSAALFEASLRDTLALAEIPDHLMPIKQQNSPHLTLGTLRTHSRFNTPQDCTNYAARMSAFKTQADQLIALMDEGIARGVVRPKITIEQALPQFDAMIADDPTDSPLYEPALSLAAGAGGAESQAKIRAGVADAVEGLRKLRRYLNDTYLPACRETVGYCYLPDGAAWYRALAKHHTTTNMSPETIHQLGLTELKRIHEEMREVMTEVEFDGTLQQFIEHMRNDPDQHNKTPEEIMRRHREILKRSDANLPKLFGRLPKTPYDLKEIEAFRAPGSATAYYYNAPDDGSRPAYFYINVYKPETRPIYTMEALAYHEAQPGHHLQIALAQERKDWPAFRRFEHITAFIEGWALYSERLGYDLGGYQDPYARFGQLTYDAWRSSRLVVDTGMHYFGWSRERAIEFMKENTGLSEQNIISEIDRYIAWPGQALGYKVGQLEISRLREEAEQALGERFDIRAFHDHVLAEGSIPMSILRTRMREWIARQ